MNKKTLIIIICAVAAVAVIAAIVFFATYKDYSRHSFDFFGKDFSWDMTKEEAAEYIESNAVQTWREIEIKDYEVTDGMYSFDFNGDGQLQRVRYDMGGDPSVVNTCVEWFGEYDKYERSDSIDYTGYTWYGMMDGEKTEVLLYIVDGSVYLHFMHAERY